MQVLSLRVSYCFQEFYIEISPPDADVNRVTKESADDMLVLFTDLKANTSYTITVTGVANTTDAVVLPAATVCSTKGITY